MKRNNDFDQSGVPEKYRPIGIVVFVGMFYIMKLSVIVAFLWASFLAFFSHDNNVNLRNAGKGMLIVTSVEMISTVISWFV